jgi:acyl carrier protein
MDPIETKVRAIVAEISNLPADMPADANLYLDLGVASIHALQLLTELEERFGVAIPDDRFVEATSINELTALMTGLAGERAEDAARA